MSLEDALALVAARGRLMQALRAGRRCSRCSLSAAELQRAARATGSRSPRSTRPRCARVSGDAPAIAELLARARRPTASSAAALHTSHAFHSAMMEPALAPFTRRASRASPLAPPTPALRLERHRHVDHGRAGDVARLLRRAPAPGGAVRRRRAARWPPIRRLFLLEVGPGTALTSLARADARQRRRTPRRRVAAAPTRERAPDRARCSPRWAGCGPPAPP